MVEDENAMLASIAVKETVLLRPIKSLVVILAAFPLDVNSTDKPQVASMGKLISTTKKTFDWEK